MQPTPYSKYTPEAYMTDEEGFSTMGDYMLDGGNEMKNGKICDDYDCSCREENEMNDDT